VKPPRDPKRKPGTVQPTTAPIELLPGQTRKETEGVFVLRGPTIEYTPIKMGIAGDRYFEVLAGLSPGDEVVTGPYNVVRGLIDGDGVKKETPAPGSTPVR
jgi:HlyD family secretion protein